MYNLKEPMAPPHYRAHYKSETLIHSVLSSAQGSISGKGQCCEYSDFSRIVITFEHLFGHVEDSCALKFFLDYVGFWELLILKIGKRGTASQAESFVSNLIRTYDVYSPIAMSLHSKLKISTYAANEGIETQKLYKSVTNITYKHRRERI